MDAITSAINAYLEKEVAGLKVALAKARSAAVGWRKRAEKAELDAFEEECDVALDTDELAHKIKNLKAQNEALRARAEKAEAALTETHKKVDAAWERGVDDGLDLAAVAAEAEKAKSISNNASVTVFNGINYPTASTAGPDIATLKGLTYEEALAKALELKCSVMVKKLHGDTWYLRGQGMDFNSLKMRLEFLSKRELEPGSQTRILYLIEQ